MSVTDARETSPPTSTPEPQRSAPSILGSPGGSRSPDGVHYDEAVLHDLALDQVLERATSGRAEYRLNEFFTEGLTSPEAVRYRQDVFRDLLGGKALEAVRSFSGRMGEVRRRLQVVPKLSYRYQRDAWLVDAASSYCQGVLDLSAQLADAAVQSDGFRRVVDHLDTYAASEHFTSLRTQALDARHALEEVHFSLHIRGNQIRVSRYEGEEDLSGVVTKTFDRFRQGAVKDRHAKLTDTPYLNHVEQAIVDRVALLFPQCFAALEAFAAHHGDFLDPTVVRFDREVQFYVAYAEYIEPLRAAGLPFCFPELSTSTDFGAGSTFDLALAANLVSGRSRRSVVRNDIELTGPERIIVVSGPNQGGKTTLARTFGQLHVLAGLGLPVPGAGARLSLPDKVLTHFEREEVVSDLRGKLEDDLVRIRELLVDCTPDSVVIMNEVFTSTTLQDARTLGERVLRQLMDRGALGVYVTFVDELATLGPQVVSMVSTVDPADPATRTYRVVRKPPDGLAYAIALAEKYGLTYRTVRKRLSG